MAIPIINLAPRTNLTKTVHRRKLQHGQAPALAQYYQALFSTLGPQHWWPAKSAFEVIVAAFLTQNTSWRNVTLALENLRAARLLTPATLERIPETKLARLIRSSGYYRQKARKLKLFVRYLRTNHGGSLKKMFRTPLPRLRAELLELHGIGPETADAILLYAGGLPSFVVDAYTRRILERHGLAEPRATYHHIQDLFHSNLPPDPGLYNEYHALIVRASKDWCHKRNPICSECPLAPFLPASSLPLRADSTHRAVPLEATP